METFRRAWSTLQITKSTEGDDHRILEGIASTPSTDRAGDKVDSEGAKFNLPLPLLAHHNSRQPIGHVTAAKVSPTGITITATIVKNSGLDYVEEAWKQIKAGLVRGLSIGFAPLEYAFLKDGGVHFKTWDWLELSAVTIPANADAAISTVKMLDLVGGRTAIKSPTLFRRPAVTPPAMSGTPPMNITIGDRIKAAQVAITALKDALTDAVTRQDDGNPDPVIATEIDELTQEIDKRELNLNQLKAAETRLAISTGRQASNSGTPAVAPVVLRNHIEAEKVTPVSLLFKMGVCELLSHASGNPVEVVMRDRYKGLDEMLELRRFLVEKATQAPASTTNATWASALVNQAIGGFIDLLDPISVYPKLANMGGRVDLGAGVKLPYREDLGGVNGAAGDLRAAFVGELDPIPVRRASIKSLTLSPKKMGVISTFSREIAKQSNPAIEGLIRSFILRDTAIGIDVALLDALPATAVRPAGLMNGVTPGTGSATGTTLDKMLADIATLLGLFAPTQQGRSLAWLLNPAQALQLGFVRIPTGSFMFEGITQTGGTLLGLPAIVSPLQAPGVVALVDASSFWTGTGDTPEWSISDVATIHEDDGGYAVDQTVTQPTATVKPIGTTGTPAVVAAPVRSLWQTASYGIRMLLDMDWGFVRSGSVKALTVTWS